MFIFIILTIKMYKLTVSIEDNRKTVTLPKCLKIECDEPCIFVKNCDRVLGLQQCFSRIQQ